MLRRISKDGRTIKYVKDKVQAVKYLPNGAPIKFEYIDGISRFHYPDGVYDVEDVDKKIGNYTGNVCPICQAGEMTDAGGCSTCNACGAQLKCGL